MAASQITGNFANIPNLLGDGFYGGSETTTLISSIQTLSQIGDTIFLEPGGSSVNVEPMPAIQFLNTSVLNLSSITVGMNFSTLLTTFDYGVYAKNTLLVDNGLTSDTLRLTALDSISTSTNFLTVNDFGTVFKAPGIITNPAFVYYVSTNGRLKSAGATGTINDPFSLIADALTMPSNNPRGMVIFVAPGEYSESFTISISNDLRACSIVGVSDDTRDSKRAVILGKITIIGTDVNHSNTVNTVVLNNLRVSSPAPATNAISAEGYGIRVYLKNGLYSSNQVNPVFGLNSAVIQVANSGTTKTNRVQMEIDDCSITASQANIPLTYVRENASITRITHCDFTNNGGSYALYANIGNIGTVSDSAFISTTGNTAVLLLPGLLASENPATDAITTFNNCYISSQPDTSNAIIALNNGYQGITPISITANISLCSLVNTGSETVGVPSLTKYIDINSAGVIFIQRSQIITVNSPTTITPYTTNNTAGSGLYYLNNSYISGLVNVGLVLPSGWTLGVLKLTTEP